MKMHEVREDDLGELALFLKDVHGSSSTKPWTERFSFFWDNNPAFTEGENRGLLFREGDSIVGFIGRFPTLFRTGGSEGLAYNAFGLAVRPDFRGQGLGSALREEHLRLGAGHITFATTPSRITRLMNDKQEFKPLPRGFPPNHEVISLIPTGWLKSALATALLWVRFNKTNLRALLPNSVPQDGEGYRFTTMPQADPQFNQLWGESSTFFRNTSVRTSGAINWHLTPVEDSRPKHLCCCYLENGELAGYAILAVLSGPGTSGLFRLLYCSDFWMNWRRDFPLGAFAGFMAEMSKSLDCAMVVVPHFNRYFSQLLRRDFPALRGPYRNDFFHCPVGGVTHSNSFFSSLQGDATLNPPFTTRSPRGRGT